MPAAWVFEGGEKSHKYSHERNNLVEERREDCYTQQGNDTITARDGKNRAAVPPSVFKILNCNFSLFCCAICRCFVRGNRVSTSTSHSQDSSSASTPETHYSHTMQQNNASILSVRGRLHKRITPKKERHEGHTRTYHRVTVMAR